MSDDNKNKNTVSFAVIKNIPNKYKTVVLFGLLDLFFAALSYYLSYFVVFFSVDVPASFAKFDIVTGIFSVFVIIVMLIFFDCYNTIWRYAGRVEFFKTAMAYFVSFAVLMLYKLILYIALKVEVWAPLIMLFLLFSALLSVGMRFFTSISNYLKHVKQWVDGKGGTVTKRTIVIGAGYTGSLAISRFINNPHEGYFPVALIDDDPDKQDRKIYGIMVEGGMDDLDDIVWRYRAQAIVIAIMSITKPQLKNIYSKCIKHNIPVKIMPAITNADQVSNSELTLRDIKIEELLGREEFKVQQNLIDSAVKDKVVLVTGGAGSIGSELCRQALNFGCKHLVVFDMHENGMFELNQEFKDKYDTSRYTLTVGTVRETKKLKEVFEQFKPSVVFHAAAYKHVPMMEISATEAIKNNVFGTLNVINQAIESGVDKFVFISTDKAVNPANIMGASKRIAEMVIQKVGNKSKMKMAAVRFGNVLGSNGSVIPTFLKQIRSGGPITVTDRNIKRYFMTIPEAVRLVLQTSSLANSGEVFVLDMGEPVYIYDLACDLIRINGLVPEKDIQIQVTGLRPGEKLFEELRYDKESVDKTVHEGIFVTRLADFDMDEFEKKLQELYLAASAENIEKTTDTIFSIVPNTYRNMAIAEQISSKDFINQGARTDKNNAVDEAGSMS